MRLFAIQIGSYAGMGHGSGGCYIIVDTVEEAGGHAKDLERGMGGITAGARVFQTFQQKMWLYLRNIAKATPHWNLHVERRSPVHTSIA